MTDQTSARDPPVLGEQLLRLQRPRHGDPGRQQLGRGPVRSPAPAQQVQPAQDPLDVEVVRLGRLLVWARCRW